MEMKISLTKTGCGLVVYFAVIDMYMGSKQVKSDLWIVCWSCFGTAEPWHCAVH